MENGKLQKWLMRVTFERGEGTLGNSSTQKKTDKALYTRRRRSHCGKKEQRWENCLMGGRKAGDEGRIIWYAMRWTVGELEPPKLIPRGQRPERSPKEARPQETPSR